MAAESSCCIEGEFEKILTKLRLSIKDNNNYLYRVSFVDFYFAFPQILGWYFYLIQTL